MMKDIAGVGSTVGLERYHNEYFMRRSLELSASADLDCLTFLNLHCLLA